MNIHAAAATAAIQGLNRVSEQRDDLRRRVDRTLDYVRELLAGPLDSTTRITLAAVEKSLMTPTRQENVAHD